MKKHSNIVQQQITKSLLSFIFIIISTSAFCQNWNEIIKAVASDREDGDWFGYSVAISGNYAIVGAFHEDHNLLGGNSIPWAGSAYIFEKNGSGIWNEKQKIIASDRASDDRFGWSVAISNNYVIVGAFQEDHDVSGGSFAGSSGSAYIFERDGSGTWSETQKIVASDRSGADYFGYSVAISGNYAIVGGYGEDHDALGNNFASDAGSAYLFERDGFGLWSETQKIIAADRTTSDNFGFSVAISGNYAIIGAYLEDHNAWGVGFNNAAGSAYLFEKDVSGIWNQKQKMVASDRAPDDNFGHSVAISGNYAIVGAYLEDHDISGGSFANYAGAAYIFERDGIGMWSEKQKIVASDRASDTNVGDHFGWAVGISGDYAIVGAPQQDWDLQGGNFAGNAGASYLFERDGIGVWSETQKLAASDRGQYDYFGRAVAISDSNAIVGAYLEDHDTMGNNPLLQAGSAYIFSLTSCQPITETYTITACDSFIFDGITYTTSNTTAKDTLINIAGCDSIVTLNLTINYSSTGIDLQTICDSYVFNEITYTTSNTTAKDTLINTTGCDSIVTLNLTINYSSTGIDLQSSCDSYVFNGITYTTSNTTAKDTLINTIGCDSIVTLNLTINSTTGVDQQTVCDSYTFNGITYTASNSTAKDTLLNAVGCDSIITLNLTVESINSLTVTVSNNTLSVANQATATYQWKDCSDNSEIIGATNTFYVAPDNGYYAVIITVGSCTDTSICSSVTTIPVNSYQSPFNSFQLFPNPATSQVTVSNFNSSIENIAIINVTGKVLKFFTPTTAVVDLSSLPKGIYFVKINCQKETITQKLVLQ